MNRPADIAIAIKSASAAPPTQRKDRIMRAASFSWIKIAKRYQEFLQDIAGDLQR